jgi:hypothetical protein
MMAKPCATRAAERAASRAISSSVECVAAVDFDDQPGIERCEVGDETAKNDLAPKSEPYDLSAAKTLPEAAFGAGRIAT